MKKCQVNIGKIIIVLVISVIFMSTHAIGDIAPPNAQGETMQPINVTNVQMVNETVYIDLCVENATVKCNFTLMNHGANENMLVGFPVGLGWEGQGEDPYTYPLEDFKAYVNSQPVETREMDVNGSMWMVWDMSFDEMEIKDIDVSYWVPLSYYGNYGRMASHWFTYVLKTGAAWGGVIEEANITIVLHDIESDQITELTPDGYVFENNIITWNFTSIEPTENIYIQFETLREEGYTIPGFVSDENHAGIPDATVELHYWYPDNSTVGGIIGDVYGKPLVTTTSNGTGGAVGWYNLTNLSDDGEDWIDVVVAARVLDAVGNERMGISDPVEFWPFLGWYEGAVNVTIDLSFPTGLQDKSLAQVEGQPEVYWLQNNRLYWVTDWNVINDMSGVPGWGSVNTLPASEFDPATYPQGPRFITTGAESDGLLIREQGHPEVYLILGGEKHHFTSPEALLWNGYSFDDVIDIEPQIIAMFASGYDISTNHIHNINKGTDYTTIQAAIDDASPGDEIHVDSGTYYENVVVNKQLTLRGIDTGAGIPVVDASNSGHAINLSADGIILEGFTATNASMFGHAGIRIISNNNIITNNNVSNNNRFGIFITYSSGNTFTNNDVNNNSASGVQLYYLSDNTFTNNNFNNNDYGIYLAGGCYNNIFTNNNASNNGVNGISVYNSSNNEFINNNVNKNDWRGIRLSSSNNNILYYNNFVDNTNHNIDEFGINQWDSGSEGNYYSDYTGTDSDGDGIGDTPYPIPGGSSMDRYPLMAPWTAAPLSGKIAFASFRDGNQEVYVMNAGGNGDPIDLTNRPDADDGDPTWSPDGNQIAFSSNRGGNWKTYVMNADDGSDQVCLLEDVDNAWGPAWSPDGKKIAVACKINPSDDFEIYTVDIQSKALTQVTDNTYTDSHPSWSPDSHKIVFTSACDGNQEIYVADLLTGTQTRLTDEPSNDDYPEWSPDGSMIAFVSERDGNPEIYSMNIASKAITRLTHSDSIDKHAQWSPDGQKIVFISDRDGGDMDVYVMKADGTGTTCLIDWDGEETHPTWSSGHSSTPAYSVGEGAPDLATKNHFIDAYNRNGGVNVLGSPTTEVHEAWGYLVQDFPGTSEYAGGIIMYNPTENSAYYIHGAIWDRYYNLGGPIAETDEEFLLGIPTSDVLPYVHTQSPENSPYGTPFRYQNFSSGTERAALVHNLTSGEVFEIHGAIYATWSAMGYANNIIGLVTSDEREAVPSFKGTTGRVSDFENGHLHWHSSGEHEGVTYVTYGELDEVYASMGGTASWLGFPVMDQEERDGHGYCEFEGGYIECDGSEYKAKEPSIPSIDCEKNVLWGKTFDGVARSTQQTSDGGYIFAGYTKSFEDDSDDALLIKTDSEGNEVWSKTYGGINYDWAYSVQQTSDGGYILAGRTVFLEYDSSDALLIKTDSEGNEVWSRTFGGANIDDSEEAKSVQQTFDGGYIFAGYVQSFGEGSEGAWLMKIDSEGNEVWSKTFGGNGYIAYSVQQTSDGGYIIGARSWSFEESSANALLIKTDSEGTEVWSRTFGGADSDYAYSIQQISDGGYILAGSTRSFGEGSADAWLIKTDSEGNEVWSKTFGGGDGDYAHSVQQISDGGYILAGDTRSFGEGSADAWLIKTDSEGNEVWNKTFGGENSDSVYWIKQTSDGSYVLAGNIQSFGEGPVWRLMKIGGVGSACDRDLRINSIYVSPEVPFVGDYLTVDSEIENIEKDIHFADHDIYIRLIANDILGNDILQEEKYSEQLSIPAGTKSFSKQFLVNDGSNGKLMFRFNTIEVEIISNDYNDLSLSDNKLSKTNIQALSSRDEYVDRSFMLLFEVLGLYIKPMDVIIAYMETDPELSKLTLQYQLESEETIDAVDIYVKIMSRLLTLNAEHLNPIDRLEFYKNVAINYIIDLVDLLTTAGYSALELLIWISHIINGLESELGVELSLSSFIVESPVDIEIINTNLQHVGYVDGQIITDIENSYVKINGSKKYIMIFDEINSDYIVKLTGTGEGTFSFYTYTTKNDINIIAKYKDIPVNINSIGMLKTENFNKILNIDFDGDGVIDQIILPTTITILGENLYNISFLPPITTTDQFTLAYGSTLPIKFTARDNGTGEFIYDDTVNVTITNSIGSIIANFNTTNGVQIDSDLEQYAVDFNTPDYPELTVGETYSIRVTFGDVSSLRGFAIAYFTIVDRTSPSSITNPHPTAATTYLNWTWTNPPDPDFNHTEIYVGGVFQTITSSEHYNATDLTPETSYTISTRTVDTSGNINQTWMNDTATTLPAPGTTIQLTISLNSGWNLISAPLNLTIRKLGEEAAVGDPLNVTPEDSLTSIYRYNTTSELFEKCTHYAGWGWAPATGSESFTELEPGRGYWAMAENDCDLTFTGTAPSDLSLPLDADWNCIGWYSTSVAELGNESLVCDPLSVTPENNLTSIYRYNTTSELFEKCTHYPGWGWEHATGSESFTELEPGRGYWAMAENDCVWNHET